MPDSAAITISEEREYDGVFKSKVSVVISATSKSALEAAKAIADESLVEWEKTCIKRDDYWRERESASAAASGVAKGVLSRKTFEAVSSRLDDDEKKELDHRIRVSSQVVRDQEAWEQKQEANQRGHTVPLGGRGTRKI